MIIVCLFSIIRSTVEFFERLKRKYRYSAILLRQLVLTDFKLRYKSSVLGYIWTLLRPLALFAVLYIVFVEFLHVGGNIPHYAVYLLLGVVFWNYFVEVTNNGVTSVVGRIELLRKLSFPRYTVVVAGSLSALINLSINLVVIAIFMVINNVPFTLNIFWLVPLIAELSLFSISVAFILSALYVRFRDVNYIWEVVLQAGFYATPILYPITLIVDKSQLIARIVMLNPIAQIIQDARHMVITQDAVTIGAIYGNSFARLLPLIIVICFAVFGGWFFRKKSPTFAEDV